MIDDDYDVGMDSNEMYDENIAPEIKNDIIQDLTFVMILKNYNKKVKIEANVEINIALMIFITWLKEEQLLEQE